MFLVSGPVLYCTSVMDQRCPLLRRGGPILKSIYSPNSKENASLEACHEKRRLASRAVRRQIDADIVYLMFFFLFFSQRHQMCSPLFRRGSRDIRKERCLKDLLPPGIPRCRERLRMVVMECLVSSFRRTRWLSAPICGSW